MIRVLRHVREVSDEQKLTQSKPLDEFRETPVWVLLGEPGAGKSTSFESEAKETGGKYLRIAEFLELDLDDDDRGKTLFLDGLDEVRAGGDNTLLKIRNKLKKLGNPPFRISCRAADWYGTTDQSDIAAAAADGKITVLLLEPLAEDDILCILRENHGVSDPENFVKEAQKRGIDGLLNNPQTLGLLAKAVRDKQFPATRQETYLLACREMAAEANKIHRDKKRGNDIAVEARLDAAGHLCAVLLFANHTGIALDSTRVEESFFVEIEICQPPDSNAAYAATGSKLFRPAAAEERVEPAHRTIAEFLAARWLGQQIDQHGLSLKRVLNLLLGHDGRTVAGLRGLYAWLALACTTARSHLIQADPFTVVIYGDVGPMSSADKQVILQGLKQESELFYVFRWQAQSAHPFGALAAKELIPSFITALTSSERNEAAQSFANCVLEILAAGESLPELLPTVEAVVLDTTRWDVVRQNALRTWLKLGATDADALSLLDDISDGKVVDQSDELAGMLLHDLYPRQIKPENLLRYLHVPKQRDLGGMYQLFWEYELPSIVSSPHLPVLLDQLVQQTNLASRDIDASFLLRMIGQLLRQAIEQHGEHLSDEKLLTWLGVGLDEDGTAFLGHDEKIGIADWLTAHPERYKALLALCYQQSESLAEPLVSVINCAGRLYGAKVPEDLGAWHLAQVTQTNNEILAKDHLACAFNTLNQRGGKGLTLEVFEAWGIAHPGYKDWLDSLLFCEITESRQKQIAKNRAMQHENYERKRTNSEILNNSREAIRAGLSPWLRPLAEIWLKCKWEEYGKTPGELFNSSYDNGKAILAAAEAGFRFCVMRPDLPTVDEIIELNIWQQEEHLIRLPCLVGMELLWQDSPLEIDGLPVEVLRKMVAFKLDYDANRSPAWFDYLINRMPSLVAGVLVRGGSAQLDSISHFLSGSLAVNAYAALGSAGRLSK